MASRTCSQCFNPLPELDDSCASKSHIACAKCGKLYSIRKEKKHKLVCPNCNKKSNYPDQIDLEMLLLRCPHCHVTLRLGRRHAADETPVPSELASTSPDVDAAKIPVLEDEVAYYGDTLLIDDSPRRLPRAVWILVAVVLLAALTGALFLVIRDLQPTSATVHGTVYYGEKPVGKGVITFAPHQGKTLSTEIQENGVYRMEHVPFTEMRVLVVVYPEELHNLPRMSDEDKRAFFINWGRRPVTILPEKYADAESTPFKFTPHRANCLHELKIEVEPIPPAQKRQSFAEE